MSFHGPVRSFANFSQRKNFLQQCITAKLGGDEQALEFTKVSAGGFPFLVIDFLREQFEFENMPYLFKVIREHSHDMTKSNKLTIIVCVFLDRNQWPSLEFSTYLLCQNPMQLLPGVLPGKRFGDLRLGCPTCRHPERPGCRASLLCLLCIIPNFLPGLVR